MAEQIEEVERTLTPTNGSLPAPSPVNDSAPEGTQARVGLASVIVPCFNQRGFTQLCIKSLLRHTRLPWELILIDNGSTDDTAAYLAGVQDAAPVPVTVIRNSRNLGFPAAVNQGLQAARGEYLMLLNNDAVVTDGWLDQLIALASAPIACSVETAERDPPPPLTPPSQGGEKDGAAPAAQGAQRSEEGARPVGLGIGLVGPMSNYAAPPQLVEGVPYRNLEEMQDFARRWRDEHRGKWFTVGKLSGFCLLMKRAVYRVLGGLDPRFGLGLCDDDDLAERARRAGFALAVAQDLFVHHFGSRTFTGNGIDAGRLLDENARRFAEKWGRDVPLGRRVALRPWRPLDGDSRFPIPDSRMPGEGGPSAIPVGPSLSQPIVSSSQPCPSASSADRNLVSSMDRQGPRPRITLTVIARDEETNLPACLGSVQGLFDEIVVVDTGSTDRTREIAEEFGARVFDFAWIDDFAAARNAALSHATGEYAFWLDADDVLDPPERVKLEALLARLQSGDAAAYVVRCACDPGRNGGGGQTVVDHIRLFPLREEIRWTYRVHEQILPALRQAEIPVLWTDLVVRHTGYADPELRARKLDRDQRILLQDLTERPDDPFLVFNLGAIAVERAQWPAALDYLRRSLAGSGPWDSITRKVYALIARCYQMLGDSPAALKVCDEGLALDPADAELWFRKGVLHRHRGEPAEAEACWRRILRLRRPENFCSLDQGIYGHVTRRNLAVLAAERGDAAEAARLWQAVLAECPGDHQALAMLGRLG